MKRMKTIEHRSVGSAGPLPRLTHARSHLAVPCLGVDIGRVIIAGDGPDTSFIGGSDEDAMRAPEMPGAIEALTRLRARFEGRVWLVSKCGPRIQARTREWLAARRFFERTGIEPAHLEFCRTRPEKAPICARLGVTCFVDDRWDVLASMAGIVPHRIHFGQSEARDASVAAAPGWREVEAIVSGAGPLGGA
jgi:hypothetical protein